MVQAIYLHTKKITFLYSRYSFDIQLTNQKNGVFKSNIEDVYSFSTP